MSEQIIEMKAHAFDLEQQLKGLDQQYKGIVQPIIKQYEATMKGIQQFIEDQQKAEQKVVADAVLSEKNPNATSASVMKLASACDCKTEDECDESCE